MTPKLNGKLRSGNQLELIKPQGSEPGPMELLDALDARLKALQRNLTLGPVKWTGRRANKHPFARIEDL